MKESNSPADPGARNIEKSDDQWRQDLTEEQYQVTRCSATEAPFSGEYWNHKAQGMYRCICCGEPLFSSEAKFDSGTGWPSFFETAGAGSVDTRPDHGLMMRRTEIVCHNCGAHLGHLFDDAPQTPTGQRYCVNSASLKFDAGKNE